MREYGVSHLIISKPGPALAGIESLFIIPKTSHISFGTLLYTSTTYSESMSLE